MVGEKPILPVTFSTFILVCMPWNWMPWSDISTETPSSMP